MQTRFLVVALSLSLVGCAQAYREQATGWRPAEPGAFALTAIQGPMSPAGQLEAGTLISITLTDTISTGKSQVGDIVSAVITRNVKDAAGALVLPAGADTKVRIVALQQPMPHRDDARLLLEMTTATVGGITYHLESIGIASVKATKDSFKVKGGTKVDFTLAQSVVLATS